MSRWYRAVVCLPGSPLEQSGGPLENKAELITLAVGENNILELRHDTASTLGHQAQGPVVIGLGELVLVCKPGTKLDAWLISSGRVETEEGRCVAAIGGLTCGSSAHPA